MGVAWVLFLLISLSLCEKQKGVNFLNGEWSPSKWDSADAQQSFSRLAKSKTDYLALTFVWYQWNISNTTIYPRPGTTPTDQQIAAIVKLAHSKGSKVMLRPLVDPDWTNPQTRGTWRGMIGANFTESTWDEWFSSYSFMLLKYAKLAQELNADEFSVGGELIIASHQEKHWRALIPKLYKGPILYGANHGNEDFVKWWDLVDYIAIDAYYPIAPSNPNPSLVDLKKAWGPIANNLKSLSEKFNKKIIFSEIGYCSKQGTNINPAACLGPKLDLNAQANLYEATYEVFWNEPWFEGIFWWAVLTNPHDGGPTDEGFSPLGKPAEQVIAKFNAQNVE